MKVYELIALLDRYPPQSDVVLTWESTVRTLTEEQVYISHKEYGGAPRGATILDADDCMYKQAFAGKCL